MNGNELAIRLMQPDDVPALQALEKAARSRYGRLDGFRFVVEAPPIADGRLLAGQTFVAMLSGQTVGLILLEPQDGTIYIANISVSPDASNKGVGRALMQTAEDYAAETNLPALTLTTFKAPPWNAPWFRKLGYLTLPEAQAGPTLRATMQRQAQYLDADTRITMWKKP